MFEAHEVHPDDDIDWTKPDDPSNWDEELRLRDCRNRMIQKQLLAGKTVQYKSTGWSLFPLVHSNDCCMLEPMSGSDKHDAIPVHLGDVVFCEVYPSLRFYCHKIVRIDKTAASAPMYIIGNNKGHENGWCNRWHIYGRLMEVVYTEHDDDPAAASAPARSVTD